MKGQLTEASSATSKAYCVYRREMDPEIDMMCAGPEAGNSEDKSAEEVSMSPAIAIMQPILRFLQLLCENHNRELQVLVLCCVRAEHPAYDHSESIQIKLTGLGEIISQVLER